MRTIEIPELSLVALIGASGSGKSTFGRQHFLPTEILSSDFFRGLVSDDENDQASTPDAFDALYYMLEKRLARGRLTVVDATNVRAEDRKRLIEKARKYHCFAVAIVLNTPEKVCQERNVSRPNRDFGPHVVRRQIGELKRSLRGLEREGFRHVHILDGPEEVEIRRTPLWNNKKDEAAPFDIFGDLHGCADELRSLLERLGWERYALDAPEAPWGGESWRHPLGRKAVFLGDLVDRGPNVLDTVRIVRNMVTAGTAFCIAGNHDVKFMRWLRGKQVQVKHGLEQSIAEVESLSAEERAKVASYLDGLVSHYVLDGGRLVVAHAGLREEMHGRGSGAVREFCLYGETTGETDEFGLPIRYNWASEYRGKATVVYGHTPIPEPEWLNNTVNIDTGAVFGGKLTALRYPEREFVSIPAAREYSVPIKPLVQSAPEARTSQQELDDVLDLEDVTGKRFVETRLQRNVTIREENSIAALEVMSRFATDPHWLIYLPPTMSPSETSTRADYLEYPTEAFAYFRKNGVQKVVCEEKHMGSRAVVVVCRDITTARKRFGVIDGRSGVCYTRTGRPFFSEPKDEAEFIARVQTALSKAGFWDEFASDWFCLDCELMPWSAKARELLQRQYAPVGAAGVASLEAVVNALKQSPAATGMAEIYEHRLERLTGNTAKLIDDIVGLLRRSQTTSWRHFICSHPKGQSIPTRRIGGTWKLFTGWQQPIPRFIVATPFLEVDVTDDSAVEQASQWWESLTGKGGEGMVVKPLDFVTRGPKGLVQPALKCRGREYLRIIYGPEYTADDQLPKLRSRGPRGSG